MLVFMPMLYRLRGRLSLFAERDSEEFTASARGNESAKTSSASGDKIPFGGRRGTLAVCSGRLPDFFQPGGQAHVVGGDAIEDGTANRAFLDKFVGEHDLAVAASHVHQVDNDGGRCRSFCV
jgi:hypothetical protein